MSGLSWNITRAAQPAEYAALWDEINSSQPGTPVLDSRFVTTLLEVFGTGREYIATASANGRPVAVAIFEQTKPGIWQTFQPSQAPLGLWLSRSDMSIDHLLGSLAKVFPGFVLALALTQQDPDLLPRPVDELRIRTLDYLETARISITRPFAGYWDARDKNVRHQIGRRLKRLSEQGITPRLEVISDAGSISEAVANFGRLENAGWKGREGTAVSPDNTQGNFYSILLQRFAQRGEAKVYRYWFEKRVAAMELTVESAGVAVMLKTTYDEEFRSSSPGVLMRAAIFEQIFANPSLDRIEFLGKVLEWQRAWYSSVRTLFHLDYYPRPLLARGLRRLMTGMRSVVSAKAEG